MIRLGLRLARSGREAIIRLAVIAVAVALGTGLLLATLAGVNAVNAQRDRYAWLAAGSPHAQAPAAGRRPAGAVWFRLGADQLKGSVIDRVDVAAIGPHAPVPPGIPHLPGPGQYYVSPQLSRLLRTTPAAQLADRFPGRQAGLIGRAGLPAPNFLLIIIGHRPAELSRVPGATRAAAFPATYQNINCYGCAAGLNANAIDLALSVVAAALLLPVLIFVASATRLSAASREQRFAAMRLAGATPRQISVLAAVEAALAASAGTAAGFGLFFLIRPPIAALPFTGFPFFTSDMSLSLADILLAAAGIPAAATIAARLALRRVRISPLGVTRRVTPGPPRAWRVVPLLAGVAELAAFLGIGRLGTTGGQIAEYLPGFVLIVAGLVIAGPWLTMIGSRALARRARRPAALIAARRLADNPRAGFRAISGLILALFVTTVAGASIIALDGHYGQASAGPAGAHTLVDEFSAGQPDPATAVAPPSGAVLARLHAVRGVTGISITRVNPTGAEIPFSVLGAPRGGPGQLRGGLPGGLISCAQLARTPVLGRCPPGASAAVIPPGIVYYHRGFNPLQVTWPAATISAARLSQQKVLSLAVATNGSPAAIEQAQTILERAYPYQVPPATINGIFSASSQQADLSGWQQLANVVIIISLVIAGCSLAASVAAGLSDRKRPFSLLRLTGAPLSALRRVVMLESAVPLLVIAVVSAGLGFVAALLFIRTQFGFWLRSPGTGYYVVVITGLAAALGVIASTMPLLGRITGPETARNE
ncbi:MAG TPA: FtsX-like permease family protein [Streptosporangiaceae bacterium]|jgi:hypothetical protein